MTSETVMSLAGAVSVCLAVLVAAFLLIVRSPIRAANHYLAAFFLLTALDLTGWLAGLLPTWIQSLMVFRLPLAFLQMPMLCAYVVALYFPERETGRYVRWGGVATVVSALSLIPRGWAAASGQAILPDWQMRDLDLDLSVNEIALHLQFYIYATVLALLLVRYRRDRMAGQRPDGPPAVWLLVIVAVSLVAHTLVLAKSWAWIGNYHGAWPILDQLVGLVAVLITFAMALTALTQQGLFTGPEGGRHGPRRGVGKTQPPDPEALARLNRFMAIHEPYLDPSLTIRSLSRRIGMGQRELSVLINQQLGLHFFDFLNRHRVEKAAEILAGPGADDLSVLEIAHRVGFDSKSSFNAAFRKHRGETPTAHRVRARQSTDEGSAPTPE